MCVFFLTFSAVSTLREGANLDDNRRAEKGPNPTRDQTPRRLLDQEYLCLVIEVCDPGICNLSSLLEVSRYSMECPRTHGSHLVSFQKVPKNEFAVIGRTVRVEDACGIFRPPRKMLRLIM